MTKETDANRDDLGRFVTGHTAALKHGGEGALLRLRDGQPFDGLALQEYQAVLGELGVDLDRLAGVDRVRLQRAARFEAVARLFDAAAMHAASVGDLEKWERYQRRAGWIGSKSFAALGDLRGIVAGSEALIIDALTAAKDARGSDE